MIPIVKQEGIKDCGISCMLSIIKYYKGNINIESLREMSNTNKYGVSFLGMKKAFLELGFFSNGVIVESLDLLKNELPLIAQVTIADKFNHFVVIYKIKKDSVVLMDPSTGLKTMKFEEFRKIWTNNVLIVKKVKDIPNFTDTNKIFNCINEVLITNKRVIVNVFLLAFICTFLSIINSYYLKILIDEVLVIKNYDNLYLVMLLFSIVIFIKYIASIYKEQIALYISKKIDYFLMTIVYKHILLLPYTYFKNKSTGEIISRLNDLSNVRLIITKVILTCLVDIVLVILASVILININMLLYLISLITVLIYLLLTIICSSIFKKYINDNQVMGSMLNSFLVESFSSYESIKGTNSENKQINKFKTKYKDVLSSMLRFNNFYCLYNHTKEFVNSIMIMIIIGVGSKLVIDGVISLGQLITFNSLLLYFYEPIKNILELEPDIKMSINSIKRINTILNVKLDQDEKNIGLNNIKNIKFHQLNYSYNGNENTLANIGFDIKKGEKILINGKSGIGKSTIVKLLMKYYKTTNNTIFINGIDINNYSSNEIREKISYISQNEILTNDTVYNNIVYDNNYDIESYYDVCRKSGVDQIGAVLEYGHNYLIEENGFNISGGERQRIILARHLLLNKEVLIMDEATSALDVNLERSILKSVLDKNKNKIIIHISHHNENMDLYDKVITISKGKVTTLERAKDGKYN